MSLPTAKASTMLLYDGPGWLLPVLQQRQVSNVYTICPNNASDLLTLSLSCFSTIHQCNLQRSTNAVCGSLSCACLNAVTPACSCGEHHPDKCAPDCMSVCVLNICWQAAVYQRWRHKQQGRGQSGQQRIAQEQSQVWGRHSDPCASL